ncbi:ribonucleoside-diphosphate reductase small chain [Glomus cerebriforme]|uniref:Ribonucleoside-diphosphate reductase small chain n=1 Tax=Glomus cerebriforme TaxID=658196 RepID=A0A397S9F2_9GLOM|nr:ribonucleoside-diphosphate reductase small chain [Glomus cerebriforme]
MGVFYYWKSYAKEEKQHNAVIGHNEHAVGQLFSWEPEEKERIALFPILHEDLWQYWSLINGLHWTAQKVDLTHDKWDWMNKMDENERTFIRHQLVFFVRIDFDVLDNIDKNFREELNCMEVQMFYTAQQHQECVHIESYSLQAQALLDGKELEDVFLAIRRMPVVSLLREWVMQWFNQRLLIGERLVAFGVVEGVLFSASFASLQWLREKNLLPGITDFNSYIARDEGIHTLFTCMIIKRYFLSKSSRVRVKEIFDSAIKTVDAFVDESLPTGLSGIDSFSMKRYMRFQADCVLNAMGYGPFYFAENPFPFMDKLSLNGHIKVNFFEKHNSSYQLLTHHGSGDFSLQQSDSDSDSD